MKEYCQAIIEQFDDNDICKKCNRPYGEHYGLECPKEGTVIIKRDLIKEALSARDKEWEEKIEKYHDKVPFHNFTVYMTEDEWQSLLSQMNDTKRLKELNPEQKEYDVDNEPVFPICGTCNARKSNLSWLMLTPEQLNKVVWRYTDKEKQTYALGTIIKEIAKAQINHLAKPEFGIFKLIDGEFIRFEHYLKENEK